MILKAVVAIVVGVFVVAGGAQAQAPIEKEKDVTATNLVTSLGGFRGATTVPVVITGQVVEIKPGGQTGRQRHTVPSYIYVLEGDLVTNSFGGPVGVNGVQYHTAGQSYMDAPNVWHNHSNTGQAPVKYLLLFLSTPGAPTITQKAGDE
jgi:quercetin dioxygenase-like cupin family protein